MPTLSPLQLAGIQRSQRKFKAAANTHGPLRCVLIHKEGEDLRLPLSPPGREDMPAVAQRWGALYSERWYCRGPGGEEIPCTVATTGTGRNLFLELDEPVSRHEQFAVREIYLLRKHKDEFPSWPIEPEILQADPNWQELARQTHESQDVFLRLAGEAGRCFGADDCGALPRVARESLEATDDEHRWLWIVFDLAWKKVRGSPLRAERWVWHETQGEGGNFFAWELNTDRHWADEWKRAGNPTTGPLAFLKAWAERRPGFYYSSLDDLFSASVWAIDLLKLHEADTANRKPAAPGAGAGDTAQEPKTEADWHDVQARLLRLYEAGEAYTSQPGLAKRLKCAKSTINKAINDLPKLKGWMARHAKPSPKAQSLNEVVTDNTASRREDNPADRPPDDEVDRIMARLIEQSETPENRAKLNGLNDEGRREMVKLYLAQQQDKHIEDKAAKGNRILGRKP